MLRTTWLQRNSGRRVRVDRQAAHVSVGRTLPCQTCAHERKKRWSPVRAVDHGRLRAVERELERLVGDAEAAEVADVLADRERAVDRLAVGAVGGERVVLGDERRVSASNAARSSSVHQLLQRAGAVVLRALVVEAVADLVTDHRADRRRS